MKKNVRTLIILGAVLVVCIGAYIGVSVYTSAQARKTAEEAKSVQIWSDGRDAPVSISYTAGDKTLSFVKDNSTWYVADNRSFPLSQDSLTGLASALNGLTAVRTLDLTQNLSVYGLDKPQYTLTASDAGGNGLTLLIGSENGGNYYAVAQGGDRIYTIAATLVGDLKPDYLGMIALDTVPSFTSTDITSIAVSDGVSSLRLDQHMNKDGSYAWFIVSGDTDTAADDAALNAPSDKSPQKFVDDAAKGLGSAKFSSCAAFQPAAEDLKTFGLDTPRLTVTVDYAIITGQGTLDQKTTNGTASLEIGTALEDSSGYYARLPGSEQVNVLATDTVTPFLDALGALGRAS
jgi:hypothetical protein